MKKYFTLGILVLSILYGKAQIYDTFNYQILWEDQFTGNRSWNTSTFIEQSNDSGFVPRWECMLHEWWPYCVTTDKEKTHQAYQPSNTRFGNDNKMRLVAECKSCLLPLVCNSSSGYIIPSNAYCSGTINGTYYPPHHTVFYHSGAIETLENNNWFGYYEIKCRLPVHDGEAAAFWLFGTGPSSYEEIDIFEHSKDDSQATNNLATGFSCGIWYNPDGTNYFSDSLHPSCAHNYAKRYIEVAGSNNLSNEHIFGLEWLPNRLTWYFDGQIINEYTVTDYIPQHPLNLRVTHPVDNNAMNSLMTPQWQGSDEVVIDYIKVYQLISDCNSDVYIQNANGFINYNHGVKRSITIGSANGITVPSNTNLIMRAENSITITNSGGFTAPAGVDLTFMVHPCVNY